MRVVWLLKSAVQMPLQAHDDICSQLQLHAHQLRGAKTPPWSAAMKWLHLNFIPRSPDFALLLLRVWHGATLLVLHGWGKLANYSTMSQQFPDPFGVGSKVSLASAIIGEVVCAALLVLGLFTRVAALGSAITMGVAFWFAHGAKLVGQGNGELAFVFLGSFVTLFFAGAGRFSVDAQLGAKS